MDSASFSRSLRHLSSCVNCRTLIAVTEKYFGPSYFDQNLTGAQADQEVLKDIIMEKLPGLYRHLDDLDIEISTVTLNWFLALFFNAVPFEVRFYSTSINYYCLCIFYCVYLLRRAC